MRVFEKIIPIFAPKILNLRNLMKNFIVKLFALSILGAGLFTSCKQSCTVCEYGYTDPLEAEKTKWVKEPETCGNAHDVDGYKKNTKEFAKRFPGMKEFKCVDTKK